MIQQYPTETQQETQAEPAAVITKFDFVVVANRLPVDRVEDARRRRRTGGAPPAAW